MLVVPIAWKPGSVADSAPRFSDDKDAWPRRLLGADFLCWTGWCVERVHAMAERVLPVPGAAGPARAT